MALKQIKITVDQPILPAGKDITHVGTSYEIGRAMDFTVPSNVIEKVENDKVNLTTKYFELDIDYDDVIYVRCKYHFDIAGVPHESNWSRVVPVNSLQTGIKLSSSIVKTPSVNISEEEDMINITTSDFGMYTGPGTHLSTDYLITDTDGEEVFKRDNDFNNLTHIYIRDSLEYGKIYVVAARHTNSTNNTSNYGKQLLLNYSPDSELYSFDAPEDFVKNRKFYYRIKLWVGKFKSYDLEVRNSNTGDVVVSRLAHTKTIDYLPLTESALEVYNFYDIYLRINFQDGTKTEYKKVFTSSLLENKIYHYDPTVKYCDKYDIGKTKNTEGITCSILRETFDNKFIGVDFKTNSLNIFKLTSDNELFAISEAYKFDRNLDIDYINIIQLPNHDVLVDVVMYTEKRQAKTMFLLFEYDPIKLQLILLKQKIRVDERYTTSVSNSLVVTNAGEIYYIPSYLTNGKNDTRIWLKLRKLETPSLEITDINMPYDVKYFANVILDRNDNVYVFGGSYTNYYNANTDDLHTETWEVNEKEVYRLDKTNNTFELWTQLPAYYPDSMYCIQPIRRKDGLNILFNAVWSGDALEHDKFITFEPISKTFNELDINGQVRVPVRSAMLFNIGDVYRYTSKVQDPQACLIYNSNTNLPENIPDFTDIEKENIELTVGDGVVVTIEDIYKYSRITINGTGLLKWYRPQGITVLNSKTLIVNKDTIIAQNTLANRAYEQILVLDGCELRINTQGTSKIVKTPSAS